MANVTASWLGSPSDYTRDVPRAREAFRHVVWNGGMESTGCRTRTMSNHDQPEPDDHSQLATFLASAAKSLGTTQDHKGPRRASLAGISQTVWRPAHVARRLWPVEARCLSVQ